MYRYKFNPDTSKVHRVTSMVRQCNESMMDGDEKNFEASSNSEAVRVAKSRFFAPNASKCGHCMQ